MSVFDKIWGGVKFVASHVAAGFKALFGEQAAADFAKASVGLLKTAVGQVAFTVVEGLMHVQTLDSNAKRASAFEEIGKRLAAQGKQLGKDIYSSEIYLLIEVAVQALKGKFGPVQ